MEEKLGKDASATIADDIGLLISENEKTKATLKEQTEHIEKLQADKEKLVLANGNLLKQIPMGEEMKKVAEPEEKPSPRIDLASCFDGRGMFKR